MKSYKTAHSGRKEPNSLLLIINTIVIFDSDPDQHFRSEAGEAEAAPSKTSKSTRRASEVRVRVRVRFVHVPGLTVAFTLVFLLLD